MQDIPDGTEVKIVNLEDWVSSHGAWDNHDRRVTLIGDAAHSMTMCKFSTCTPTTLWRGGANWEHIGVKLTTTADVASLMRQLFSTEITTCQQIIDAYEAEMIERTGPAVLKSRQACIDAHDYPKIGENSPLIMKRIIVADKQEGR